MENENKKIVQVVLEELEQRGLIKKNERSAYSKVEVLLYNYNNLKKSMEQNQLEIEDLEKYGWPKKSSSVAKLDGGNTPHEHEYMLLEERKDHLRQSNARTEAVVHKINRLLLACKNPKYPDLLERIYFDGKTREECAEVYNCSIATISRSKSKIIREIATILLPSDVINELGV